MSFVKGVVHEENKEYNLLIMAPEGGAASITIGDTSTVTPSNVAISYDTTSKDAFIDFTSTTNSTLSFTQSK